MKISTTIITLALFTVACTPEPVENTVNTTRPEKPKANSSKPVNAKPEAKIENAEISKAVLPSKQECIETDTGDNAVLASQTFPVDLAPLGVGCLVTEYNPEFDDPPMESQLGFYQDGKLEFRFPEIFNGATSGCWIEAVGFEDLNADDKKDVIVVGKCNAKGKPFSENMIYVNNGKAFTTDTNANQKLSELTTIEAIKDFAKQNKQTFSK